MQNNRPAWRGDAMPKKRINIEQSFQCSVSGCDKIFSSIPDRNWHMFSDNHKVKNSKCRYCDLSIYSITHDEYVRHLETHKQFRCEQCDMKFPSKTLLIKHYHDTHTKILKCDKCSKMFWTQQKLDIHHMYVFPRFKCRKCPRMLTTEYRRNKHEINMHNAIDIHPMYDNAKSLDPSNKIKCNICEITFVTKYGKHQHIMSIHDNIKYECHICHIKYTSSWYLKIHIQNTHTENKIKCSTCNKIFAIQSALHRHFMRFPTHQNAILPDGAVI